VALNLAGVEHGDVIRGDAVVHPGRWRATARFDATIDVLPSLDHEVSRRGAWVAYIGSGEHTVKVRVLGDEAIAPGTEGLIRLHLASPLPLLPGDRFILRESGRNETVGGGEVLDVAPVRPASKARPDRSVERVVAERGWIETAELELLTGEDHPATIGRWITAPGLIEQVAESLVARVAEAGPLGLDVAALDEHERAVLQTVETLVVDAGRIRPAEVRDPYADHPAVELLRVGGLTPPPLDGVDKAVVRELIRRNLIVERDGVQFHPEAIEAAGQAAARLLAANPEGFTVAEFRDEIGATRKHVLPLLGEIDARAITRRRDDLRIAGPRLPTITQ
jgi:selenocysteine-specific elongation factor